MRTRRAAFSLIELIVVIGMIAILIAMLLPALTAAREHANQVKCAAQLRSLGQGFANYAVNFKGWLPPFSDWQVYGGDGTGEDSPGLGWSEMLEPYFASPIHGAYSCPDFPPETQINYFMSVRWLGVNHLPAWNTSQMKRSSELVLSGDCTHARLYPPPFGLAQLYSHTQDCDKDDVLWKCLSFFGEDYGRNAHHGGNNVLFADDHVACFKGFDGRYMTYDPNTPGVDWPDVVAP